MQMLFVDESGTPPKPGKESLSPYFVLGGCVIPENFWHLVKADFRFFDQVKKSFRRSSSGDIHGYGLVNFPKE